MPDDSGFATWFDGPTAGPRTTYEYPRRLDLGPVPPAPTAVVPPRTDVDLLAHWYDDFGKEATAASAHEALGWHGWYDWRWNAPGNPGDGVDGLGYDPARDPLPGPYAGDDAHTLDWHCHWLASAGVRAVNLGTAVFTSAGWESPAHPNHWMHQLFTAVPNFGSLGFVLGLAFAGPPAAIEAQLGELVEAYAEHRAGHTLVVEGETLATVFCWDLESLRRAFDGPRGGTRTREHLRTLAGRFRAIGYDGVALLARNAGRIHARPHSGLRRDGLLLLAADYESRYGSDASYDHSYARYASTVRFPTDPDRVLNVVTAAESVHPHPSRWTLRGSTPALFEQVLRRAVAVARTGEVPPLVTVYNVSEWAEGGPGLLPQRRDGFGYLAAVRRVVSG
jgi:hypothetical protein